MQEKSEARDPESWTDRVEMAIAIVLQFGLLVVTVSALFENQWLVAFNGAFILFLSFTPAIIERRLRVPLPVELTLITCIFLYASFALGEVRGFYEKIWWWDLALHGLSGLTIGIIGFLSVYVFYMTRRIQVAAGWIATITFALAVSVGTLWEIFEFLMDWYFGFNMQKSGLIDTMTDLLINVAGATIAAAIAYAYVNDQDSLLGRRFIRAVERFKNRRESL